MKLLHAAVGLVLLLSGQLQAQIKPSPPEAQWQDEFFNFSETALPKLFQAAMLHSTELEKVEIEKQIVTEDLKMVRRKIYNSLSVGSSYSYGTISNLTSADQVNPMNTVSAPASGRYLVGINLMLPLDNLVSRPSQIHKQQLIYRQAESDKKAAEQAIRRSVIARYQDAVLSRRLMAVAQDALQTADISNKMAEKQFVAGEIQVDKLTIVSAAYTSALAAYQDAEVKYETAIMLLEELVGISILDLMLTK